MPEHDFEQQFERRLRDYAQGGVRPFDAMEIAHLAATRSAAVRGPLADRRARLMTVLRWALVAALLVVGLVVAGFAAGLLPPDTALVPTPTPTANAPSPEPTASPSPPASPSGEPTPSASLTPTPSPEPSPTPSPGPTPSPTLPPLAGWQQLTDFPFGDATHLTGITAGGPGFVAVGWASDGVGGTIGGRAWTSTDGRTWAAVPAAPFEGARLLHVAALDGGLLAIGPIPGDDEDYPLVGQDRVWRSADGTAWELVAHPAQFDGAVVQKLVVHGDRLIAGGYRDAAGRAHAVIWISSDGVNWREAAQPPGLYDIAGLATDQRTTIVALGNDPNSPPWRSVWYSTDGGESWLRGNAPMIADPEIDLADLAGGPGGFVVVGKRGDLDQTEALSIVSADGVEWTVTPGLEGPPAELPMQVIDRVVGIGGGFLAIGALVEVRETPCAPINCIEAVPVEPRAWTAAGGGRWQEATAPGLTVDMYSVVAAGPTGVLVASFSFEGSVWFAPYGE